MIEIVNVCIIFYCLYILCICILIGRLNIKRVCKIFFNKFKEMICNLNFKFLYVKFELCIGGEINNGIYK